MINILLRTSRRPIGFKRTIEEILRQSENVAVNIIVSADNDETISYVKGYGGIHHIVECKPTARLHADHNPYNEYFNEMIKKTVPGWVWRIDDDDLIMPNALECIQNNAVDPDVCYIFNLLFKGNIIIPQNRSKISYCDISTQNFVVHTKHNNVCKWKPVRGGDYRYLKDLLHTNPSLRIEYIDKILYKIMTISSGDLADTAHISDYCNELLLKAYISGKTWILELGNDQSQREWCHQLSEALKQIEQRVVLLDTAKMQKSEFTQILPAISADYYVISDPLSAIFSRDEHSAFLFEKMNARLFFFHQSHITRVEGSVSETAQRILAYRRVAQRGYHICFDKNVGEELAKLNIGPVSCVPAVCFGSCTLPANSNQEQAISTDRFVEHLIVDFNLPVQMSDSFSKDISALENAFQKSATAEIDNLVGTFLRKHGHQEGFLAFGHLFKEHKLFKQAYTCYFEALKIAPENKNALKMLKELHEHLPQDAMNVQALEDLQALLSGSNNE
jgi:hypothetical protein